MPEETERKVPQQTLEYALPERREKILYLKHL